MKIFTKIVVLLVVVSNGLFAFSRRVDQMPNGRVFGCANCHINPAGGSSRNDFGKQIAAGFLQDGDLVWSPELAALDADGDGATNGEELQNPGGTWKIGDAAPGNIDLVTNPGDAASVPVNTRVKQPYPAWQPEEYMLGQNFPNPFNPTTNIEFTVRSQSRVTITVFNINGEPVKKIVDGYFQKGKYQVIFDGRDENGIMLSSGLYIYQMKTENIIQRRQMILLK
ncbi:T9SS type A sorting domain-containing protein [candidate division KSB1 bacterium]|nr:T9SS type A sorting domain-containing protein [candidate division KSB1 bacterium]